jgi:hypothetical protein
MLTASLRDMFAAVDVCMQCGYLRGRGMSARNGRTQDVYAQLNV